MSTEQRESPIAEVVRNIKFTTVHKDRFYEKVSGFVGVQDSMCISYEVKRDAAVDMNAMVRRQITSKIIRLLYGGVTDRLKEIADRCDDFRLRRDLLDLRTAIITTEHQAGDSLAADK